MPHRLIRMANPVLSGRESEYVNDALRSGWISSQGEYVRRFEASFSSYCGVKHGIAVSNGTCALHLALAVLGVGPGDEVVVPTLSHIAVATAVTLTGARMVLVDSDPETWGIDPRGLSDRISARTRAIIVVHLYGHPVNMDPILNVARDRGISVIEDAAEAHGSEYRGVRTGGLGAIGCFSFYANKIITSGEGGMLVTNSDESAERARKLRDQAYEPGRKFVHAELGFNYRLTNLQAAVGLAQFEQIEAFIATRRKNAAEYNLCLSKVEGITPPPERSWARNTYWMYSVLIGKEFLIDRDQLVLELFEQGIESRPFFYPIHLQPLYRDQFKHQRYPIAEQLSATGINLPSGNELTISDVRHVSSAVERLSQGAR